jgi:hypothetical protein
MVREERGVVIIAVLWICMLLMWFAMQISAEIRLQGAADVNHIRKSQALLLSIGGINEGLARIGQPAPMELRRSRDRAWLPDGLPRRVKYRTGQATVIIEKETVRVNVNRADHNHLMAALEKGGVESSIADNLADVIGDFIDTDDTPRLNGAEQDQYRHLGLGYGPFNGPLTSIDQLLLIPGVTPRLLYGEGAGTGATAEELEDERDLPRPAGFFSKHSLVELLTVYGNNVQLLTEKEPDGISTEAAERYRWEAGGIYRILSYGESGAGPPGVLIWVIVRQSPQSDVGYEILFRKVL